MRSQKCNVVAIIYYSDETEKKIAKDDTVEKLNQQKNKSMQRKQVEPDLQVNIFPCNEGEIFDCEEITSDEVLDEKCKGILKFSSGTSSCFCRGANHSTRNSKHIERKG